MIDGFELIPEAISEDEEEKLTSYILSALDGVYKDRYGIGERSRVKRYGYDYTEKLKACEDIPEWLAQFSGILKFVPGCEFNVNSVTINEYKPGHGIAPHVDENYFGPVIVILSLGGMAVMELFSPDTRTWTSRERIPRRSLLILSGEIRRTWKHGIDGESVKETRYSIVFRERLLK